MEWRGGRRGKKMKEAGRKVVLLTFPSDPATEHQFCDIKGLTPSLVLETSQMIGQTGRCKIK